MRPKRVSDLAVFLEATGLCSLNAQSKSERSWRLRFEADWHRQLRYHDEFKAHR
jgi:hypothetical protein